MASILWLHYLVYILNILKFYEDIYQIYCAHVINYLIIFPKMITNGIYYYYYYMYLY
jgi:hypothetical protein